jgi:hypothetical protein
MISLKRLLTERRYTDEELKTILNPYTPGVLQYTEFYNILKYHGGAEYIASQFAESVDTSRTPYASPMGGAYSKVYWLKSGKILKITINPDESATGAYYSKRRAHPHIIAYYDVREVVGGENRISGPNGGTWAMITDGVRVLTDEEQTWYHNITREADFLYEVSDRHVEEELMEQGRLPINDRERQYANPAEIEFYRNMLSQRQSILRDIRALQVAEYEAHAKNVGFDEHGQFVIFDIWSRSPKTKKGTARRMQNSIDMFDMLRADFTTDGIDTPGDPDM